MIKRTVLACVLMATGGAANAEDEVVKSINEGTEFYNNGEYAEAVTSLNYAVQLIQQKKGDVLKGLLPEPLDGWTARDAESQSAGAAMFGGGVTAERNYSRGDSRVTIRMITDSPMMQGVMMMFSNPMFATSDGGKLERIGKQKAIVKYDEDNRSGDLQMVVNNRFLVMVEGDAVTRDELLTYAAAIDTKKLSELP
jgi:hypothetical protein